jgi:GT2 family glycosyltransferase
MKSVTAVVVTHNSKDSIERPLQSVVDSTIADAIELVLVDNASADGTADLVRQRFPGCRVIDAGENLGFGRACNLGARESESEHILLLNPDAWVDASCVERLRGAMAGDQRLGWAAPRLFYPDGARQFNWTPTIGIFGEAVQRLRNRFESRAWVHDSLPRAVRGLGDPGWYTAACALVRRRAWNEVEGFDPGFFLYFEDADLGLRLRNAGWRAAQVDEARAFHDRHTPVGSSESFVRSRESQLRYYRKHRPRWESRLVVNKQTRAAAKIADAGVRARMLAVCERARAAVD